FASRWRAKSPDALCAVLPKIDLIEGHRVSVICNDGRVYEGFGAVPCIGEDENGEETDAVLPYEMIWKRKWEVSL
ncbi:hypothetical protein, partial [Ruminococcus callidus]